MESLNKWFCNILQYSHLWYLTKLVFKEENVLEMGKIVHYDLTFKIFQA